MTAPRDDAAAPRPTRGEARAHAAAADHVAPGADAIEGTADETAWAAHAAVLDRLSANQRHAEADGWTSCAIERAATGGRFELFGVRPGGTLRERISEPVAPQREAAARAVRRAAGACVDAACAVPPGRPGPGRPSIARPTMPPSRSPSAAEREEARERLPRAGERARWRAQDAARDAAHARLLTVVSAYTWALRAEGASPRQAAVAVAAAVRAGVVPASSTRDAPTVDAATLARLVHDAGCRSVEAYYTR